MRYCFAAPHAYGLFDPSSRCAFGGAEVRAWLFGTALARQPDTQVSFIVFHDKSIERERFGEVDVWRHGRALAPDPDSPYALSRFFRQTARFPFVQLVRLDWRLPLAVAAHVARLAGRAIEQVRSAGGPSVYGHRISARRIREFKAIDADIYCAFGASTYAAELAEFCRAHGRRLVLFVSSDENLSRDNTPGNRELNVYDSRRDLCHYALTHAHLVITQTAQQRQMLKERFDRESVTIPNPIGLGGKEPLADFAGRTHVLWVGKANAVKRPEILLQLAAEFPNVRFKMVLNRAIGEIFERTVAAATPNLEIREFVPYAESDDLFRGARLLVNTSRFEGFPNTFLQAGKFGVPVLSLEVDPDGFITRHDCGLVAGSDARRLARGLALLHDDEARWRTCSANIAAYVRAHHDPDGAAERLRQALMERGR